MTLLAEWHESFAAVEREWDALADATASSPFLRPGWLGAWWSSFGRGRPTVLAVRRDGALVAVLPLQRGHGSLRSMANWHSTSSGLLATDSEAALALAHALFDAAGRSLAIPFLEHGHPGLPELVTAAHDASYRTLQRVVERPPFAALDGGWDRYWAGLGKNVRGDVGRRLRRLHEAGDVTLDLQDGSDRLTTLLEEGFAVEASGWKGERGTAISSRPETRSFYTQAARWAARSGMLQLAFLRLDGRAIAFHLNLVAAGVHYHVKGGFDPAYRQYSPGKVLHRLLLERACVDRVRCYDFLGSDESYKLQWASGARELVQLQAFRNNPAGRIERAGQEYGRPLVRRALGLRTRLRDRIRSARA